MHFVCMCSVFRSLSGLAACSSGAHSLSLSLSVQTPAALTDRRDTNEGSLAGEPHLLSLHSPVCDRWAWQPFSHSPICVSNIVPRQSLMAHKQHQSFWSTSYVSSNPKQGTPTISISPLYGVSVLTLLYSHHFNFFLHTCMFASSPRRIIRRNVFVLPAAYLHFKESAHHIHN